MGLASLLQIGKQFLLHLLKQVETNEYVCVVFKFNVLLCYYISIDCSLVSYALVSQTLVVVVIYVAKVAPQTKKAFLQLCLMVVTEVGKEAFEHLALLFGKIRQVVKFVYVFQIAEYLVSIGHILVNIVEIGKQQLPPAVEVVERLIYARTFYKRFMQVAYQFYGVAYSKFRVLAKQLADSCVCRTPHGLACYACKIFVQEQCCTFVREYYHDA